MESEMKDRIPPSFPRETVVIVYMLTVMVSIYVTAALLTFACNLISNKPLFEAIMRGILWPLAVW
jgi:hypothetical protein